MRRCVATALGLVALAASAVAAELKVSVDDLNEAGEHSIEIQANKASRAGPAAPDRRVPFQFAAEYAYGITDEWQISGKLPFAREGGLQSLGAVLELRYVSGVARKPGAYWGANLSAGRSRETPGEAFTGSVQVTPVLGYRTASWHLAMNAELGLPASGEDRRATFFGAARAAYRIDEASELGVEYFVDPGVLRNWRPREERHEYLFVAWNRVVGNELGVALGRGLTEASERWILKLVYAFPLPR